MLAIVLGEFGIYQVLAIVVVLLLLFGGRKIPELMKGLGSGIKEFKGAMKDDDDKKQDNRDQQQN
ncbi:twin-arginine translocase TatA/TatE family subunit [Riemerella columbipharyngis]|uniref:Sec-independent protein translocase protein TatA n=1 Tax=Riemerella columbipharyngis TaxID=1071918 RepID=A0A1G7CXL8_9FLAO|nr:twin-arginine translocase TatA/TatE family subunit [Riemerella columbipharyngis]SDE43225.1 sec-independent protein translocase protein TatA [Riemerella columbipharyngis]